MSATIAVVGSLNEDLVISTARAPGIGETVLTHGHSTGLGGKGGNQAVAAARLGGDVIMVARVGEDEAGRRYVELLEREMIDTRAVSVDGETPTGLAVVVVEDTGDNRILVSAGSNGRLAPQHLGAARERIESAAVALAQLEVPLDVVVEAFRVCRGVRVLNAAPAMALPAKLLGEVDILVVNESELAAISGSAAPSTPQEAAAISAALPFAGTVITTLGHRGSVVQRPTGDWWHEPALSVCAVDTTAAGDAFCGALAQALATGLNLAEAVRRATTVSAVVVTRTGALSSLPTASDLNDFDKGDLHEAAHRL